MPVFVLLIYNRWQGKIVTTSVFLVPVAGFGFTFYFKTSSCHYAR